MTNPAVSVLIVTWNGEQLLERSLPALAAQSMTSREIIIVDNGSTDATADIVARLCPEARLIRASTNLEFARGNILGLRACRGQYLALLNNDCVPEPDWLERAVAIAESTGAGMVATRMLRAERPDVIDSAGIALDRAAIAWDRGGGHVNAAAEPPAWGPLFGPSGGAALYRSAVITDVGFLAPEFGMYYEDVDLAWRIRLRGWSCASAPDARVRHLGSASSGRNSARKRYLLARNKLWTVARCYPTEGLRRYLAAIVLYDVAAAAAYSLTSPKDVVGGLARFSAISGRIDALRGLGGQLVHRRVIQSRRVATNDEIHAAMAPIPAPWHARRRFAHLPEGGTKSVP